jgi:hypothetical protein
MASYKKNMSSHPTNDDPGQTYLRLADYIPYADARYCFHLPERYDDLHAAPFSSIKR